VSQKEWSNLAKIVARRTYARKDNGYLENWDQIVERAISGNVRGHNVPEQEVKDLLRLAKERKAGPAGRGYWFSGSPAHQLIGGVALNNCWYLNASEWMHYVIAQDLLMLGGGVGLSVERQFTDRLPKVKKGVTATHKATKDAAFIVPDSREGWCELTRRVLEAFFVTGKSFTYSTVCLRGYGEPIKGFGGVASGPLPLIEFVSNLCTVLQAREGLKLRPIDAADLMTSVGQMVVAGNVRRSAIIILGDPWDKDFLRAKRWDLQTLPSHRARANYSVVADDVDDLHPLFWKTYEAGEPFGIINRTNIRKFGRMGEPMKDSAEGVNPCVPAGTEILTDEGYVAIEDVVGRPVNVWNGWEWSEVTPRVTGHNQPLVTVILSSGQTLTCTKGHMFITSTDYKGGTEKVLASELTVGTKLAKHEYPLLKSGKDVPYAYTQGFISAEGMDDYNFFYVYAPKMQCISRMMCINGTYNYKNGRMSVKPTFDKHPKSFVPMGSWSVKSRLDWFAGLLDGDGCLLKEGGTQISSVNRDFLLAVQKMLTTLGVSTKVRFMREAGERMLPDGKGGKKLYFCATMYRMMIGAVEMQSLIKLGLRCERLQLDGYAPQRNAGQFVTVEDVIDAGVADEVYCFTEPKRHTGCFEGIVTGQCGEATLENGEPCNLVEQALCNMDDEKEFVFASRMMMRYGKRVCLEQYHHDMVDEVIKRNLRVGIGITGCLSSPLFKAPILDRAYQAILEEDRTYSKQLGLPLSIRHTVVKPSGTLGKVYDCAQEEGIHGALAPFLIQRVQFASNDKLLPALRAAGHHMEPLKNFDGSIDPRTMVVDFYVAAPDGAPTVETGWDTWKQLDVVKMVQKHWADQAVSVTVYYKSEEIPKLKHWLMDNLKEIKTISFLKYSGHGFLQAPKEPISQEQYEKMSAKIKPLDDALIGDGDIQTSLECEGGSCPIK
jgi:hypothetical protein